LMAAYIEEVRIGFDRWAEDPGVVAESKEEGFYKVSNQFVIQYNPKAKTKEEKRTGWLVFPDDARKAPWSSDEIDTKKGPVRLERAGTISGEGSAERILVLKGEEAERDRTVRLVAVHAASLPDFARYYDASLLNPKILVGVFLGCMATFVFCAMTMKAVGRAAQGMVEEVRRQFKENPGIMDGSETPDYTLPVAISTRSAQKEMILPSLLGLLTPIGVGVLLGVGGVLGLLVGTLTCGFCLAIFMANSGGSWDNAKKYIEAGNYGGKGSEAHKAGVVGDTVGDPFKDTSGPSLNILIKLMSMVSVVAAGLIVRYSLTAMGIF